MIIHQQTTIPLIKKIDNYAIYLHEKIGEGSFSQVFRGVDLSNHNHVAVKKIRTADIKSKIARRLLDWEKSVLKNIEHPNIIKCLDIHDSINNCYIITELCNKGDVGSLIKQYKTIQPEKIAKIIYSVYEALQYLYQQGIIHRDLKASNIFIHQDHYKLGDFGFAIRSDKIFKDISVGSPVYMSPEGLISNLYGPKTDIWSFGILIYELLHGTTPLASCKTQQQLKKKVVQEAPIRGDIDKDLEQLIRNCLRVSQQQRYNIRQVGQCNYIKRIRCMCEQQMDIQKDLTNTKQSLVTSISDKNNLNLSSISYQTALSLMQYCRFLNQVISFNPAYMFSKYLILISSHLKRAKISAKNLPQQKQKNLKEIIKQYNQNYIKDYGPLKSIPDNINLQELMAQCQRLMILHPKDNQIFKNLLRETELLQKCADLGMVQSFAKKSRARQYLAQIKL